MYKVVMLGLVLAACAVKDEGREAVILPGTSRVGDTACTYHYAYGETEGEGRIEKDERVALPGFQGWIGCIDLTADGKSTPQLIFRSAPTE